jgi:hypothetical protein
MPETYETIEPFPEDSGPSPLDREVDGDVLCIQCGYNLRGLTSDRNCPECGTPVARSLRGNLLRHSSVDYLRKLHVGVFLILAAIIAQILLGFAAAAIGIIAIGGTGPGLNIAAFDLITTAIGVVISAASLVGWWMFSSPDPAFLGAEQGQTARQVIRGTVIALVAITLINLFLTPLATPGGTAPIDFVVAGLGLLSLAATAVKFFAAMLYMRWLTPRIPDEKLFNRSKLYMWLLPLLGTVGLVLCGLGPLIALVLYWNHFEYTRRHIKQIRREVELEGGMTPMQPEVRP